MICFLIYGVFYIYVSKHNFNSFEKKMYYILIILGDFFLEIFHDFSFFLATRIRFIEADPDPADQNETDPDPQNCI